MKQEVENHLVNALPTRSAPVVNSKKDEKHARFASDTALISIKNIGDCDITQEMGPRDGFSKSCTTFSSDCPDFLSDIQIPSSKTSARSSCLKISHRTVATNYSSKDFCK